MAYFAPTSDREVYELVHQMTNLLPTSKPADRRRDRRHPFSSIQCIAPRRDSELPANSEFVDVQCHDLTRGGFSFLLPSQPDFDRLVVALDSLQGVIHVAAEVRHTADVLVDAFGRVQRVGEHTIDAGYGEHSFQTATPMVLVGCRFTDRASGS